MLKKLCLLLTFFLIFCFCARLLGDESVSTYFPNTIGSYWVYEDQDGNELTRRAIEGEEIASVIYHGFSYEPELEDWADFNRYMFPSLYNVNEEWVTFIISDEIEKAVKARFTNEMETYSKLAKNAIESGSPPGFNITFNLKYDVEVEADDQFNFLNVQATPNEEWDAAQINATITLEFDIQGLPDFQNAEDIPIITLDFTILEAGKIIGIETVETAAGTFKDCMKIEYRTETTMTESHVGGPGNQPGESVTKLWLAPNVGIVKFHQEAEKIFLQMMPEADITEATGTEKEAGEITSPSIKTFELKKYKIATEDSQDEGTK